DLAADERRIKGETEALEKRAREGTMKLMRDKVDPVARRAREQAAQLKQKVESIEPGAMPPYSLEDLEKVKQRVGDLDRLLGAGDVDEARHAAREADQGLASLGADLRDEEARSAYGRGRPQVKRARERTDDAEKLARQIAQSLDEAMPKPSELMSEG